jgi:hypothetical protein
VITRPTPSPPFVILFVNCRRKVVLRIVPVLRRKGLHIIVTYSCHCIEARPILKTKVVSKVTPCGQHHEWLFITLVIKALNLFNSELALVNKPNITKSGTSLADLLTWFVKASKHIDNHFVDKSLFTPVKVGRKLRLKVSENLINELGLVTGSKLLIEAKFFDNHVEVVSKSNFKIFSNLLKQLRPDELWFVALFNLSDPDVQLRVLVFDVGSEVEVFLKEFVDCKHKD